MQSLKKIVLLVFLASFFTSANEVFSQDLSPTVSPAPESEILDSEPSDQKEGSDFDTNYKAYLVSFEEYKVAYSDYVLKRAQYLRFRTLTSKTEAQESTLKLLQVRDQVIIDYLKMLVSRLDEAEGVSDPSRQSLNLRIDAEIAWYENHKSVVPSAGTLEDLVGDSAEAAGHNSAVSVVLYYDVMTAISEGKILDFEDRLFDILEGVKDKIERIKAGDETDNKLEGRKAEIVDRWVFESENKKVRGDEKLVAAQGLISSINNRKKPDPLGKYNNILSVLGEAQLLFKESSSYLKEVIREVKTE